MEEWIKKSDAIKALYKYNFVTKEVIEREIMDIPSADRPQDDDFKNFDRESLILLIECQKERIGELLADRQQGEKCNE